LRSRAVSKTTTQDWGFTAQLSYKGAVFGRGNRVTVGVACDGHSSSFNQSEAEADLIPDGNSVGVQRTEPIETAVDVHTTQQNVGVYITDTFDITDWMALTLGMRYQNSNITIRDESGQDPALNRSHTFHRASAAVGLTVRPISGLTLFGA
jgi:outer membrane receptor protein involved in Fe transport